MHDSPTLQPLLGDSWSSIPARRSSSGGSTGGSQPDGCQVLGRYPADKYRVTTEEVIGRADFLSLGEAVGVRRRAVEGALDRLVVPSVHGWRSWTASFRRPASIDTATTVSWLPTEA